MGITEDKFNGGANEASVSGSQVILNFDLGRLKTIKPTMTSVQAFLPNAQLTPWITGGVVLTVVNTGSYSIFLFDWESSYTGIEIAPNQAGSVSLGNTSEEQGDTWRCVVRDLQSGTTTTSTTSTTSTTTTPTTTSTTSITSTTSPVTTRPPSTGTWGEDPGTGGLLGGSGEDPRINTNLTALPIYQSPRTPFGLLAPSLRHRKSPAAVSVSVVVTAINEGPDLERTLASLSGGLSRPQTIVVVDDGSVVPLADRVRRAASSSSVPIRYVRNETRQGCARSRDIGSRVVSADLYIFVDSHMLFPRYWLSELVSAHCLYPAAMLCPISADIDNETNKAPKQGGHWGTNADLVMTEDGLQAAWAPVDVVGKDPVQTPAMMGACYAVPHDLLRTIGGWAMGLRGWGFDEEFVCARAWMMGYEVRLVGSTFAAHRYERDIEALKRSDSVSEEEPGWVLVYTRAYLNYVLFGRPVWRGTEEELELAREEAKSMNDRWLADREFIKRKRVMSEDTFWNLIDSVRSVCGINPPKTKGLRHAVNQ